MDIRETLEYIFYAAVVALINIGPPPEADAASETWDVPLAANATPWSAPAHTARAPEGFFLGNQ